MARVLVVDDDADTREALGMLLTDEGHEVAEAADGQAALDWLRATPHRWVVLLDYKMPHLDGREVLAAVGADPSLARQHAYIAMPATPMLDAPVEALRAALGVPLLPKPFDLDELLEAIIQAAARLREGAPTPARQKPRRAARGRPTAADGHRGQTAAASSGTGGAATPSPAAPRTARRMPRGAD
jgi:CheY-like chemotaxis protein